MIENTATKKEQVRNMFNNIALRYDFLNHFLSFGIDYYWRRRVLNLAKKINPQEIIDIATGTGDLAIALAKTNPKNILGVDISSSMLEKGKEKIHKKSLSNPIEMQLGDSENLLLKENTFDLATVAFGVRNFEDLKKGLSEILRVLKPGGSLIILEIGRASCRERV